MILSRAFKKAFIKRLGPESEGPWTFAAAVTAAAVGVYGVMSCVYEAPSGQPTIAMPQSAQAAELGQLQQQLAGIGREYRKIQELGQTIKEAEGRIAKERDVAAARQAIIAARTAQMTTQFALDDKITDFSAYALLKTHLPERVVANAVEAAASKWDMPQELNYSFRYRDEVRQEMTDTVGLSTREVIAKMDHKMDDSMEGNNVVVMLSAVFGAVGGSFTGLMGIFGLGSAFKKSLQREDEEQNRREQEEGLTHRNDQATEFNEIPSRPLVAAPPAKARPDGFRL